MVKAGADTFWEVYDPSNATLSPYHKQPSGKIALSRVELHACVFLARRRTSHIAAFEWIMASWAPRV